MRDLFSFTSSAVPADARVLAFRGTEAISTLYRFEIYVLIEDPAFDMAAALAADATLSVNREDGQPYLFHGVLASLETVGDLGSGALYRAVLVPRLWRLTLGHHNRVFVDESAPAILQTVLKDGGMAVSDARFELTASYAPQPHVCQYRESRFAFLSRRMEREGIYYFFEQGESRERLFVIDDKSFHQPLSSDPVRYTRVSGAGAAGVVGLRSFTCKHSAIVGSVEVREHDYLRPALPLTGQAKASDGPDAVQLYGENFLTPEDGARLASVRAEEISARQVVFRGVGNACFLRPGYTFKLEDHPRFEGEYLVTELTHAGNDFGGLREAADLIDLEGPEGGGYHVELVAIPKSTQFRPERRTPVPRIYGTERAVVDGGAESDYAQLDEHGRYLVRIHFDESPGKDGRSSTRIRMMQPHGGSPESFHFPLRKGTEVMLTFEGGDPDRPVIAGVVPSAVNPTLVTSRNSTKNILQTGGGNRLIIEDAQGKEYIHLATPHKRTFLHMGSTFNPQYHVIKNTDGTSLTYTTQLSTSYTGDDSETIVDRARVTVIGRGMMLPWATSDQRAANEVSALLGTSFIQNLDSDLPSDLLVWINTYINALAKDISTASSAATTAASSQKASDWTKVLTALGGPVDPYIQTTCALLDLTGIQDGNPVPAATNTPNGLNDALAQWTVANPGDTAAQKVQSDAAQLLHDLLAAINAAQAAVSTPADPTAATAVATAITNLKTDLKKLQQDAASMQLASTSIMPTSPSPNIEPQYINIARGPQLQGALQPDLTSWTPQTFDGTAMDDPMGPPPLNPGSDIKIVGGDNVTMVQQDSRSHTIGTSYGLVLGGQASVVRNGQRSKVMAPYLSGTLYRRIVLPTTFTPLSFPNPLASLPDGYTAQTSELYGNQFSWVDGTVTATVTQGKHTKIYSPEQWTTLLQQPLTPGQQNLTPVEPSPAPDPVHTEPTTAQSTVLHGDQFSWIDGTVTTTVNKGKHSEIFAPGVYSDTGTHDHSEATTAQSTTLHGDQFSWVDGNADATITGSKTTRVFGSQHTVISGAQTVTVTDAWKLAAVVGNLTAVSMAFTGLKLDTSGINIGVSAVHVGINAINMGLQNLKIDNTTFNLDNSAFKIIS